MAVVDALAAFVAKSSWERLSYEARQTLKRHVLDSLACALGALDADPVLKIRRHLEDFGGRPLCTLIGGPALSPDRAAFYNGALVRYLDFNDSYLARGETFHPSDSLGAVLAASEYAGAAGRDFLTSLAVAYHVQARLSEEAPVRARGFDHTVQGAYAVAAAVSRALGLDPERTAHAVAIAGTSLNALRVTRTGALSHWKGLAAPNAAFGAVHAAFLAMRGITGPREVFEGRKGFMESLAGRFEIDWAREDLERVRRAILKKYDAEIHAQSAIEAILELRREHAPAPDQVETIEADVFDVAYHIIGGGEEGGKTAVRTREDADHSLPYLLAVAFLDGEVTPQQYAPDRIGRADVQALLRRVRVRPDAEFSRRFPAEMPCRIRLKLKGGRTFEKEKRDYAGFHTRPLSWAEVNAKFDRLSGPVTHAELRLALRRTVERLEDLPVSALTTLLAKAGREAAVEAAPAPPGGPRRLGA
ncbi:MAG TPA: MmgE/PrpD family protein, partial [Planctomycetota bacterium]|nr:MmgE/PrpD family protein [Planctomycetota bacterium]